MFYAGGFLYDQVSQELLLHKRDDNTIHNPNIWAFFGGLSIENETPKDTFIREIQEELGTSLVQDAIHPLTDYFMSDFNTHRYTFFAMVHKKSAYQLTEGQAYGWFSMKNVFDLPLSKSTQQDLHLFATLANK